AGNDPPVREPTHRRSARDPPASIVTGRVGETCGGRFHCSFAYSALACFRMGMSGSACDWRLFREVNAAHEVLKAWVRAEAINPQVSFEEVRNIRGSLLICLFEKFERLALVAEPSVYGRNHVGRNIASLSLLLQLTKYFFCIGPLPCDCVGMG